MPVDEKIYEFVFKKYSKWMERTANGWLFQSNLNMYEGRDFVSIPITKTVEWMYEKNKNPNARDWSSALYRNMKNYFLDELGKSDAIKRIPSHLMLSFDAHQGGIDD